MSCVYLDPQEFKKRYPYSGNTIGFSSDGYVYSGRDYAVKKYKSDIRQLIKEINYYNILSHPCILKPLAWTLKEMALPLGIPIKDAYKQKLISIEEIVSDTLSAIAYMASLGIAHCDLMASNIIFHEGKAKIIDLGFARKAYLREGIYYISSILGGGRGYNLFEDPDFYSREWNTISSEMYPLAKTYFDITSSEDRHKYTSYNFRTGIAHVDWFLEIAQRSDSDRPSIFEVLKTAPQELIVRTHIGKVYEKVEYKDIEHVLDMEWISKIQTKFKFKIRDEVISFAIKLINRCFDKVKNIDLLICMCIHISASLLVDTLTSYAYWIKLFESGVTQEDCELMIVDIMKICGGVILI